MDCEIVRAMPAGMWWGRVEQGEDVEFTGGFKKTVELDFG